MKPKHQRLIFIVCGLSLMLVASFVILNNFRDNLVFFYSPTELKTKQLQPHTQIRIGGLVVTETIFKNGDITEFALTDNSNAVNVRFKGILPALFRGGQGIVAQGYMGDDGIFIADNLLTKHDEKYMPPEVADALKK